MQCVCQLWVAGFVYLMFLLNLSSHNLQFAQCKICPNPGILIYTYLLSNFYFVHEGMDLYKF